MIVSPDIGRVRVDAAKSLWLWGMLVPGVVAGIPALSTKLVLASLALTFFTLCVGHSVGLHRGVIHDTYRAPRWLQRLLALLFVYSGLGGPLSWARLHATRDYWQNDPRCPRYFAYRHSLARDFLWNLHMRFEPTRAVPDPTIAKLDPRALTDPWLTFLERTWPLHNLALAAVVFVAGGPNAVAVCICARTAAGLLGHWFVGYAAHAWGERRFVVANAVESGTNVWPLGVLSFGEGFHNNHHAFSWSARFGMRWHEVDLGWMVIRFLEVLRIVDDVRAWHRSAPEAAGGRDPVIRVADQVDPRASNVRSARVCLVTDVR